MTIETGGTMAAKFLEDCQGPFEELRERKVFVTTGVFEDDLGVFGCEQGQEAKIRFVQKHPKARLILQLLIDHRSLFQEPCVIQLGTLLGILGDICTKENLERSWRNARCTIYGTDGSRGEVSRLPCNSHEALLGKLRDQQMSARFFEDLVAASIQRFRQRGIAVDSVPVGWDTRDLFVDEGQAGLFQRAVVSGVRRTGAKALVLGVAPIAVGSYALAAFNERYPGVSLAFNKTASHNPPSHDGLKTFFLDKENNTVRKLRPEEEFEITAWLFAWALESWDLGEAGEEESVEQQSAAIFLGPLLDGDAVGMKDGERWRARSLVYDGANGAAGNQAAREVMEKATRKWCAEDASLEFTACQPNGRNINAHCGAGAMEGLRCLSREDFERKYDKFESLSLVWERGRACREQSQSDGRLVYGLATDGDSDRGYLFFYDPFQDCLRFIDGDAAIHLQVSDGLERGTLGAGDRVAFTIESAAPFVDELLNLAKQKQAAGLRFFGEKREGSNESLDFVLTPVGDKWVLETKPAIGGEATGHIIRPVSCGGDTRFQVHAGNGPLGLFSTLAAVERRIATASGEALKSLLEKLSCPYAEGLSLTAYTYFVAKSRFYQGGEVWGTMVSMLASLLEEHVRGLESVMATFAADPNTLLVLLKEKGRVLASIHVRCSGTEPKIGLKASGEDRPDIRALFEALEEVTFFVFALELGDSSSPYWKRQLKALELLTEGPRSWKDIVTELGREENGSDALFEGQMAFLRTALTKQALVVPFDSGSLELTERGYCFADELSP